MLFLFAAIKELCDITISISYDTNLYKDIGRWNVLFDM